ncbi:hypothetical protein BDK51DRAFT_35235, partial [Blyttiomyces helicus]
FPTITTFPHVSNYTKQEIANLRLDGSNYMTWVFDICAYLTANKLKLSIEPANADHLVTSKQRGKALILIYHHIRDFHGGRGRRPNSGKAKGHSMGTSRGGRGTRGASGGKSKVDKSFWCGTELGWARKCSAAKTLQDALWAYQELPQELQHPENYAETNMIQANPRQWQGSA